MIKYSNSASSNKEFSKNTEEALSKAAQWTKQLNTKYAALNLHDVQSSSRIALEISKFSEDGEQSIYEFIRDFDLCYKGRGTDTVKANQLWKAHLSAALQAETETIKDDLQALKEHLLQNQEIRK